MLALAIGLLATPAPAEPPVSAPRPEIDVDRIRGEWRRRHVAVVAVGDTGFSSSRAAPQAEGGVKHGRRLTVGDALAPIAQEIDGLFNFANLETVVTDRPDLRAADKEFVFATHPGAVERLVDAGFNLFALANNHSADHGREGVLETVAHMTGFGERIAAAGLGRDRVAALAPARVEREGVVMALASIGFGGIRAENDHPGQPSIRHPGDIADLLDGLELAKADLRAVSVHTGIERDPFAGAGETALWGDTALARAGVDLVLAHHSHVARGIAIRDGRLAFFGLGNFAHFGTANMNGSGICRDFSLLARIHYVADDAGRLALAAVEIVPVRDTHMSPRRLAPEEARKRIGALNYLSAAMPLAGGSRPLKLATQADGDGLYCTPLGLQANSPVRDICRATFALPAQPGEERFEAPVACAPQAVVARRSAPAREPFVAARRSQPKLLYRSGGHQPPPWAFER